MKKLFSLTFLLLSTTVFAQKNPSPISYSMPSAEVGFKWNSADATGATSNKQVIGFQLGVSAVFDFAANLGLKSGLFYSERPFEADFAGSTAKGKVTYFDVPALLMYKFESYAGVYVGPTLSIKLGDEVSPGSLTDVKSMVVPLTFGAQFKFLPNIGANVFFETVSGDLAAGVSNSRAVGVNLMITLD